MILGMSTASFTLIHMLISLTAAGSGFVVILGLLNRKLLDGWIAIFFTASILTVVTGFLFPFDRLLRSHVLGLLTLLVVTISVFVRVTSGLVGGWRAVYVLTLATALYFNCYAAVVQLFAKVPALKAKAPTQTEPPLMAAQFLVLAIFIVLAFVAAKRIGRGPDRIA